MMEKINAVITGVGGYVPDYVLTNEELSRMVDTNDECPLFLFIFNTIPMESNYTNFTIINKK